MSFLHTFRPSPIAFNLGLLKVHWYGLFIVSGFLLGLFLVLKRSRAYGLEKKKIFDLSFYLLIFGLLGARIYYLLLFPGYFFSHPLEIFKVWQGGLGIYGAVLAGLLVLYFYARKHQIFYLSLLDLIVPALILGQAIGRFGNYFNRELFGLPTDLPWGIPINGNFYHPCFLYESFWNFGVFLILMILERKKSAKRVPGQIFSFYLFLYPLGRFFIEFLRIDNQPIFFNLYFSQYLSLALIFVGVYLLSRLRPKTKAQTL